MNLRPVLVQLGAALAMALASFSAAAAGPLLDEMTWTEVGDALKAGHTTIIIPIGGTEQNGPHMALGKHNFRAASLAVRIAAAVGNAIVAPVVNYVPEGRISPPGGHMRFPGTISVPQEAFEGVLLGAARSLRQHGFRDIVFIGDSGNYQSSIAAVAARLNREWAGTPARAHPVPQYYQAATTAFNEALRKRGITEAQIGTHAGLADTSLMLGVDASRIRDGAMRTPPAPEAASGVTGDPTQASAALGKIGADLIVEHAARAIRDAVAVRR
ncbi:MAG: creatininase family protein [Pseudomonadota bacterium]